MELEGRISRIGNPANIRRTGGEISDSETMLKIDRQIHAGGGLSVRIFCSFGRHTHGNFDYIRKPGVALR